MVITGMVDVRTGRVRCASVASNHGIRGMVTRGTVTKGMVTRGMVTRGMVTKGMVTKGMVTKGMVTKGMVPKGVVTKGMVDVRAGRGARPWRQTSALVARWRYPVLLG